MDYLTNISAAQVSVLILILLIDLYQSGVYNKVGILAVRLQALGNYSQLFNVVLVSLLLAIFYRLLSLFYSYTLSLENLYLGDVFDLNTIALFILVQLIIYLMRGTKISKGLSTHPSKFFKWFFSGFKYLFIRLCNYAVIGCIFFITFKLAIFLDDSMVANGFELRTLFSSQIWSSENKKAGAYWALLFASFVSLLFVKGIFKHNGNYEDKRKGGWLILITTVLWFSLFSGLFSILNFTHNLWFSNQGLDYINQDQITGILPLRIASLILAWHFSGFFFRNILHGEVLKFITLAFIPNKKVDQQHHIPFKTTNLELQFFSQVGFYTLSLVVMEYSYISESFTIAAKVAAFSLLFIVDDYIVMYDYQKTYNKLLKCHYRKLWILNVIIFMACMFTFYDTNQLWTSLIYFVFSFLLFFRLIDKTRNIYDQNFTISMRK